MEVLGWMVSSEANVLSEFLCGMHHEHADWMITMLPNSEKLQISDSIPNAIPSLRLRKSCCTEPDN